MPSSKELETIEAIATDFRKELVGLCEGNEELEGECLSASKKLVKLLDEAGIDANVVQGLINLDIPAINDEGEEYYEAIHYWVQADNHIIDITCSQFRQYMEDDYTVECLEDVFIEHVMNSEIHYFLRLYE